MSASPCLPSVTLTRPAAAPEPGTRRSGEIACDEALFERLRQFRKRLADDRDVPAYIILSDVALRQMAQGVFLSKPPRIRTKGPGKVSKAAIVASASVAFESL